MGANLALYVTDGPDAGQVFELTEMPVTVGRHPLNTIPLGDGSISRHQFRIVSKGKKLLIEDLDSLNGTYLNGEQITSSPMRDGDRIEFGNTVMEVRPAPAEGMILDDAGKVAVAGEEVTEPLETIGPFAEEEYLNISAKKADFDRIYRSYYAFSALYQIDRISKAGVDPDEALAPILDFILNFMRADRICLLVRQRRTQRLSPQVMRYRDKKKPPKEPFPIHKTVLSKVFSKEEAVQAMRTDARGRRHTILCAPLMHHRGLSGVLYVEGAARKKPYTKADLDLFSALAFKAGSALEASILYRDLRDLFFGTVETLVDTIQEKDRYTSGHSRRVAYYASILGEALGLTRHERRNLRLSAVLHDIGKVGWPDRLLYNEDDLTPEELEQVKAHPRRGADLLERLPFMDQVIPGIRYHHEAFDGSGYPTGKKGDEIPLFARVIAVADTFDAVTTERPYQSRVEFDEGLEILKRQAKTRLDPDLVDIFAEAYPKMRASRRPSRTRPLEKGKGSPPGKGGSG